MRSIVTLAALALFFVLGEACVVVGETCNSRNCSTGCCSTSGQCVGGASPNACGNGGNACSVCPGTFVCSLGSCQPGSSSGGGSGGGFGGGTGGGFTGGGGGATAQPGDVIFTWNFAGASCANEPSVAAVRITIPGQTLANAGVFACRTNAVDGIRLLNFAAGSYGFTLEGLSSTNGVLYQAAGNFTVNGNVSVNATLTPVSGTASALISWTFPPNAASNTPSCLQAGVSSVVVEIDTGSPLTLACTQGQGVSVRLDNLTAGSHSLVLRAFDTNSFEYYRKTTTLFAQSGTPAQNAYLLDWSVGSLALRWTFSNGTTVVNCAQAGVSTVNIVLRDAVGNDVYGPTGVDVNCLDLGFQGTQFPFLHGDTYTYYLQAYGTGSVLYHSNLSSPPTATVINGQFPQLDATTPATLLTP